MKIGRGTTALLFLSFAALALLASHRTLSAADNDSDNDGLPDSWEAGAGRAYGCDPRHADLLVYAVDRTTLTDKVNETIAKATAFYAAMPVVNPDGKPGIHLRVIRGPKTTDQASSYQDLAAKMLPPALRGKAHFHVFSEAPGGQTDGNTSISGVADIGWNSFVHEMGHQLMLDHEARGFKVQSPLHPSLMSYQYETSIDGSANVQYSDGRFAKLRMRETDLDETLPFPIDALHFLGVEPYRFPLKAAGVNTLVDWNRNGAFGEKHVRADINYVDGTYFGDRLDVEKADTAAVLAYNDRDLYIAFGVAPNRTLVVRKLLKGNKWGPRINTGLKNILGDPSFVVQNGTLWLAASGAAGVSIVALKPSGDGAKIDEKLSTALPRPPRQPTLAVLDGQLYVFLRDGNGRIQYSRYSGSGSAWSAPKETGLSSRTAVGVAWHPIKHQVVLVSTADTPRAKFRLQANYRGVTNGDLDAKGEMEWIGGTQGGNASASRATVFVDTSRDAGPAGRVYAFYQASNPGLPAFVSMQVADKTFNGGWLERSAYDEWSTTASAPAAALNPAGDITYCYRDQNSSVLKVSFNGSGVQEGEMGDFDEMTFIRDHGLKESLAR